MSFLTSRSTVLAAAAILVATAGGPSFAQPSPSYGDPLASYTVPSGIGYWKARQDRAELHRYQGDPAAQVVLRQQRRNLCRNVPEVC